MSEIQRFWSHEAKNIRCVREADFDALEAEAQALRDEVEALRARVVVVIPEPRDVDASADPEYRASATGYNVARSELARLNGKVVSEGLLRRIVEEQPAVQDIGEMFKWQYARDQAMAELRALLGEGKEVSDAAGN